MDQAPPNGGRGFAPAAAVGQAAPAPAACAERRLALSFTGGKDCMLALHLMAGYSRDSIPSLPAGATPLLAPSWEAAPPAAASGAEPADAAAEPQDSLPAASQAAAPPGRVVLLVAFGPPPAPGERPGASFKAHPMRVMEAQAEALGLPLAYCEVHAPYRERYAAEMARLRRDHGVSGLVTGDIEDVAGGFMASAAAAAGVQLITPLWRLQRGRLLRALLDLGLSARISCVALAKFAAPAAPAAPAAAAAEEGTGAVASGAQLEQLQSKAAAAAGGGDTAGEQQGQQEEPGEGGQARPGRGPEAKAEERGGGAAPPPKQGSACHCHCVAAPPRIGAPLFDAVGQLLGREITDALIRGPLAAAAAAAGVDAAGEDGSFHSIVTACPLMGARRLALGGRPHVDVSTGYAYMVWDDVRLEEGSG